MRKLTTEQVKNKAPNPSGKGGFKDHPENINPGGKPINEERYGYWLQFFKNLSIEDFTAYKTKHPHMSMAAFGAYSRVAKTIEELKEFQEVANRTEGMPTQTVKTDGIMQAFYLNVSQEKDGDKGSVLESNGKTSNSV
jgi:hypothetical protein